MAKVLKVVAVVAGVVAIAATAGAAIPAFAAAVGLSAAQLTVIAPLASSICVTAYIGTRLKPKPPPKRTKAR